MSHVILAALSIVFVNETVVSCEMRSPAPISVGVQDAKRTQLAMKACGLIQPNPWALLGTLGAANDIPASNQDQSRNAFTPSRLTPSRVKIIAPQTLAGP